MSYAPLRPQWGRLPQQSTQYGGGVTGTPYGPGQNLIGQQFTTGGAPDTQAARTQVGQQLGALGTAPDRGALAAQTFGQLRDLSEPQFQQSLRGVGQQAAKFGRIGAGMTTNDLTDVQSQRDKYLGTLQQQLATESAGQTIQDRLGQLGAGQGVLGQFAGLDQQQYGNLTNERGYQTGMDEQAYGRNQDYTNQLAQLGFGGNENTLQQLIAQQYGQQAGQSQQGAGDLLRLLFQNQRPQ